MGNYSVSRLILPASVALMLGVFLIQTPTAVSDVDARIYPVSGVGVTFSHAFHIEDQELDCVDCHEAAESSDSGLDNLLPPEETCADCHEVEDPDECTTCHASTDEPMDLLRVDTYSPVFSHEKHLGADLTCTTCHVDETASLDDIALPGMVTCMDCHENKAVSITCLTCHEETDDLQPPSHGIDFRKIHADLSRYEANVIDGDKTCQTCHDDSFCQDCHEGENIDRLTHPLNFEFLHSVEAQSGETNCQSCHFDVTFCVDCHNENLVLPQTHSPGWANRLDGGRHRIEAEVDLQTCISCHAENAETTCGACHDGSLEELEEDDQ